MVPFRAGGSTGFPAPTRLNLGLADRQQLSEGDHLLRETDSAARLPLKAVELSLTPLFDSGFHSGCVESGLQATLLVTEYAEAVGEGKVSMAIFLNLFFSPLQISFQCKRS